MSQFINLHLGGASINIGKSYWDLVLNEHQIDHSGHIDPLKKTEYSCRALQENSNGTYTPRALFIDTEDLSLNNLLKSKNWQRFEGLTECLDEDSGGILAKVKYEIFPEKKEKLFERIRKLAESSDKLESFFLFFGSGGTGSGLGASFCELLKDEYKNVSLASVITYPCKEVGKSAIESYNSSISTSYALLNSDIVYAYDNLALHNMCVNNLSKPFSSYLVMNDILAHSLANLTSVFRFSNTKISDFQESLVLDNNLKMITPGFSPITVPGNYTNDWKSICMGALEPSNTMVKSESLNTRFCEARFVFRGEIDRDDSEKILYDLAKENGFRADKVNIFCLNKAGESNGNFEVGEKTVGIYSNSNVVLEMIERTMNDYFLMFSRRAFVFWYVTYSMEEGELVETDDLMSSLIEQYNQSTNYR